MRVSPLRRTIKLSCSGRDENILSVCADDLPLVARDVGVDLAGPGVDAAGDGLGFVEALVTEPRGDGE